MSTAALIMMISVQLTVTGITGYFFWRILTYKPKEGDTYTEED